MIVCYLSGGLGNQLFQYATARQLSLKNNAELVLDLSWFAHAPRNAAVRVYELWHYPIAGRLATEAESRYFKYYGGRLLRLLPFNKPWRAYFEKGVQFNPKVLSLTDNTYLHGYWQSHKYFDDIAPILNKELLPNEPLSTLDRNVADLIFKVNSVAVHVRRTDYVNLKSASDFHGVCSTDYYHSAFEIITNKVEEPHFFVFSDDIEWAKNNLNFPGDVTFVSHNGADTAFQDLRIMSLCKHKIIANSSFSWWGAWLKAGEAGTNGIVIAPRKWFVKSEVSVQDRFPDSWRLI